MVLRILTQHQSHAGQSMREADACIALTDRDGGSSPPVALEGEGSSSPYIAPQPADTAEPESWGLLGGAMRQEYS